MATWLQAQSRPTTCAPRPGGEPLLEESEGIHIIAAYGMLGAGRWMLASVPDG